MNTPSFELTPYEDKSPPQGAQLFHMDELIGHTLKAVISDPCGKTECRVVFVTETDCWLALDVEQASCSEDGADLVVLGNSWRPESQSLTQYLSVGDMRMANLATPSQLAALQLIENDEKAKAKAIKADRLRKALAELEREKA